MSKAQTKTDVETTITYTKEQLVTSKLYAEKRDLLNALLVDSRSYSIAETEEILQNFLKGKVE